MPIACLVLPAPEEEHNRNGSIILTPVDDGGIFFSRAGGLRTRSSPTPGFGLNRLVPPPRGRWFGRDPKSLGIFASVTLRGHV